MSASLAPSNKLRLNIIKNVHDIVKVDAWPNDSVKVLKFRVAKAKEFNKIHKFDLEFRNKILTNDNAIISDLKIKDMSNIHLKENHITGGLVLIKRLDNQEVFTCEYLRGDTILNLKEKLSKQYINIPVEALYLTANVLNSNSKTIELKLLGNDRNVFKTCIQCRNQIFLTLDEKYILKKEIKHPITRDELMERLRPEKAKTGDSHISFARNNSNDLDLHVIQPNDEEIYFKNKTSISTGAVLDADMNYNENRSDKPVENVYWPKDKALRGSYQIKVVQTKMLQTQHRKWFKSNFAVNH